MEIERKFLVKTMPADLTQYKYLEIEQGYLCTDPVVRIRRQNEEFILTYKPAGLMAREEYNLPLTAEAYAHLRPKTDGNYISKTRYLIPLAPYTVELDVFHGDLAPLVLAEVEFPTIEEAECFVPPAWFGDDVTYDGRYHNSFLSRYGLQNRA